MKTLITVMRGVVALVSKFLLDETNATRADKRDASVDSNSAIHMKAGISKRRRSA